MSKFFGFAMSDSMFSGNLELSREELREEEAVELLGMGDYDPCVNPSHKATLSALKERFGVEIEVPATPPRVEMEVGDELMVMQVRGLPRLTDRHEYTPEEISRARFSFSLWKVEKEFGIPCPLDETCQCGRMICITY